MLAHPQAARRRARAPRSSFTCDPFAYVAACAQVASKHKGQFEEVHELRAKVEKAAVITEKNAVSVRETLLKWARPPRIPAARARALLRAGPPRSCGAPHAPRAAAPSSHAQHVRCTLPARALWRAAAQVPLPPPLDGLALWRGGARARQGARARAAAARNARRRSCAEPSRRARRTARFSAHPICPPARPRARTRAQLNLPFEWRDCFSTQFRAAHADIRFERAAVLWNLAAVTSFLGTMTRRDDAEGIKKACQLFQQAAGVIGSVAELARACEWEGSTVDMTSDSLECMQQLMLAQAQKCFYEKADKDGISPGTVAKLARHAALTYDEVLRRMGSAKLRPNLDKGWPAVADWQSHYFHAVTHWHAAVEPGEKHQFGLQLGRLNVAHQRLQALVRLAKGAPPDVLDTYAALAATVAAKWAQATRDNDTVYNDLVPALKDLPPVEPRQVAKPARPAELDARFEPASDPFRELVPFEVLAEASVFSSRVDDALRQIKEAALAHAQLMAAELDGMDLPHALQACESDGDVPEQLRAHITRVQRAGGERALEEAFAALGSGAAAAHSLAMSCESLLDVDAGADSQFAAAHAAAAGRPGGGGAHGSQLLTAELVTDLRELRAKLARAHGADAELAQRFHAKREALRILELPLHVLREQVPRATPGAKLADLRCTKAVRETLDQLDALRGERERLVEQAKALAQADDVTSALLHRRDTAKTVAQVRAGARGRAELRGRAPHAARAGRCGRYTRRRSQSTTRCSAQRFASSTSRACSSPRCTARTMSSHARGSPRGQTRGGSTSSARSTAR